MIAIYKLTIKKHAYLLLIMLIPAVCVYGQALNAYVQVHHIAGCDDLSGILSVHPSGGTGSYSYHWSNGSTIDTAYHLGAGTHSVVVYSGSDSIVRNMDLAPFGIEHVYVGNACNGQYGRVLLDNITATYPLQFHWYQNESLLSETTHLLDSLSPGTYQYALIDADGCVDSGSAVIQASSPHLDVFLADSSLCWYNSTQVWFTPGFTLINNWGIESNSTTDTFTYVNSMGTTDVPSIGIDSLGCQTNSVSPLPFVYLQSHPDAIPIYHLGDTLSLSFVPYLQPSSFETYTWTCNGQQVAITSYSYLVIDTVGFYMVSALNDYGCTWSGTININQLGLEPLEETGLVSYPNPAVIGSHWHIEWPASETNGHTFELLDCEGNSVASGQSTDQKWLLPTPKSPGVYILRSNEQTLRLLCVPE